MKLEEAKEIMDLFVKNIAVEGVKVFELKDACKVALQEIEHLQKEKAEYEARWNNTAHELRIFENECVSKNKIRELIEMWKPKLEETDKREEKAQTQEERVVLKCIGIRLDERIKTLQDLLKEE